MNWRTKAACADADPELFFPSSARNPEWGKIEAAKAICQRCPVVRSCLKEALASPQQHGVWGGLTERERVRLVRARQQAASERERARAYRAARAG